MNNFKIQEKDKLNKELLKKIYYNINEVSDFCDIKAHVLRYWEREFSQLHSIIRRGNRRYYQAKDIQNINKIKNLLYIKGFTILGAKQFLQEENKKQHR